MPKVKKGRILQRCVETDVNISQHGIVLSDSEEFTKEVLVFLIVSFKDKFKCPVAYFFINKISAEVQSQLLLNIISALYESGVIVRSLTSDGIFNLKTYKLLRCNLDTDKIQSLFLYPEEPHINIHCILDPCHLIKLFHNYMAELPFSHFNYPISFNFIKKLHEIQEKENLKFANKLTSLHIFLKDRKMSVLLAIEVLSCSVADELEFLQKYDVNFKHVTATVNFIRIFVRVYLILS